jgi:TonB family protein
MRSDRLDVAPCACRPAAVRRIQAAALALALALPAWAAETRAVKSRIPPVYPEIARRLKIAGTVEVEARVDPEGKVTSAKALSGNRMLSPAAEEAVRKWKFAPGAAETTVEVDVSFVLSQ